MKYYLYICINVFSLSFGYSQTIYQKDDLTLLADSIHKAGEYEKALSIRKQAITEQNSAPTDYQTYLKAKYFHTNSANMELKSYNYHEPDKGISKMAREQYLDSALQSAITARDLYRNVKHSDRMFQYQLQNRIYHQTAYLGDWQQPLEQAQLGYEFLKDTLSTTDKTFVDLIFDIGYINSQLGDYSKAVENYQASLILYQKIIGENHTDVAQAYNSIAVEYRHLGLRKKELESLLKAKSIWEGLDHNDDKGSLFKCYGNLFYWYSYYGDFDKAEEYILKRKNLRDEEVIKKSRFIRNNEEIYKDKLTEWYDLMLHYSRKKDTIKTAFYADTIIKTINPDKLLLNFEVSILSSTLKFYASLVEKKNTINGLGFLNKAIAIQDQYKSIFYTKTLPFELDKVELLLKSEKYDQAQKLLYNLNSSQTEDPISNRFKLAILKAKTAQGLYQNENAKIYFDDAFSILNNSNKRIENLSYPDLKPLIFFETIDGFLAMGDFYLHNYKENDVIEDLKKANHRYFLASKIYNQLYLGQRYNELLFTINNDINERLLEAALAQNNKPALLLETLNAIENNSSKLTWSKFVFSDQRQEVVIPAHFINQEDNVKAQLNFYQNALLDSENHSEEKIALWKNKIYELKNDLSKIQDSIKEGNKTYYQLNVKNFDIATLQHSLKEDELILKYVLTDHYLYTFSISKNDIQLLPKVDKAKVLHNLKTCLADLKQRAPNYQKAFESLKILLFSQTDLKAIKKLTIIPDAVLSYFPFEALILDEKMPCVSYCSSLLMYQEQTTASSAFEKLHIGAFSASNYKSKLPRASDEINAILKIFDGKIFLNASKNEFLQNVDAFNILHLAMHSHIDELKPEFSSLNFYGDKDNRLFISELYNGSLDAEMAVLSACDTGNGFYENGEGVISLSRAFNYAGVPSTVMSLWKVDDDATAKIMTYFYEHLKLAETKDKAQKNAKLDYLKHTDDDLLKHPYYWSGFVLSGNTDALVESHNYWLYFAILPIIVFGFFRKKLVQFFKK